MRNTAKLNLKKTVVRNLRVTRQIQKNGRITNVAVCSGCHGCTHRGVYTATRVR